MSDGITRLAEVGSTNDWLLARAADLPDGHWVVTDRQTSGRGRRGRVWSDGAGNLMASVLVKAAGPVQQLSFVAALALREAILSLLPLEGGGDSPQASGRGWSPPANAFEAGDHPLPPRSARVASPLQGEEMGDRLRLKWPNDLLLDGEKLSGILLERSGEALVIGIGVNIAQAPLGISLHAAGFAITRDALFAALAMHFASLRALWAAEGFAPIRERWLAAAAGLGNPIIARLGSEDVAGSFEGLADDGALHLRLDDGTSRAIHAGEVFAL